jgi:biotin transport system ATP-binding protein
VAGLHVAKNLKRARQIVGMVFQDADSQIVGETVFDDVAFGPENLKLADEEVRRRVRESLEAMGLWHLKDRRPHLLSGGEKRRLAIAGVLTTRPEVLVFDEPFSNLDYPGVRQVLSRMLDLHKEGRTLVVTTHDLEKVVAHAGRLTIMQEGEIVRDGAPGQLAGEVETFGIRQPWSFKTTGEFVSWLS